MKDCKNKELEVGQSVAVAHNGDIETGVIVRLRRGKRYGRELDICKIVLDNPKERQRYVGYQRTPDGRDYARSADGNYIAMYEDLTPTTHRDIYYSSKILVLDNSGK